MNGTTPQDPLVVADGAAWSAWLRAHDGTSDGIWLVLAKKGTHEPTTLSYQEALEEALCSGWIDGQKRSRDAATFLQRFTPRRPRSIWSARNVGIIARLEAEGRMRERGRAEVDRARADGRWDAAYPGAATAEVPAELTALLDRDPAARAAFDALRGSARYSVLHPVLSARTAAGRERAAARMLARLHDAAASGD
ncbi:YdeI/OmpD-associated family protein [Brachybacterium sp. DNPG3]